MQCKDIVSHSTLFYNVAGAFSKRKLVFDPFFSTLPKFYF